MQERQPRRQSHSSGGSAINGDRVWSTEYEIGSFEADEKADPFLPNPYGHGSLKIVPWSDRYIEYAIT